MQGDERKNEIQQRNAEEEVLLVQQLSRSADDDHLRDVSEEEDVEGDESHDPLLLDQHKRHEGDEGEIEEDASEILKENAETHTLFVSAERFELVFFLKAIRLFRLFTVTDRRGSLASLAAHVLLRCHILDEETVFTCDEVEVV